jgi:hypothetical protein
VTRTGTGSPGSPTYGAGTSATIDTVSPPWSTARWTNTSDAEVLDDSSDPLQGAVAERDRLRPKADDHPIARQPGDRAESESGSATPLNSTSAPVAKRHQVHGRRSDESGNEQVARLVVEGAGRVDLLRRRGSPVGIGDQDPTPRGRQARPLPTAPTHRGRRAIAVDLAPRRSVPRLGGGAARSGIRCATRATYPAFGATPPAVRAARSGHG